MKISLTRFGFMAAMAIGGLGLSQPLQAQAPVAYSQNDLLLFFQNPAGTTGTDQIVVYSLGNTVANFRNRATPNNPFFQQTLALGNIAPLLTQIYGADWTAASNTLFAGAAGQNASTNPAVSTVVSGDFARTVYLTKPRNGAGNVGQANSSAFILPSTTTAQSALANNIAVSNSNANKPAVTGNPGVLAASNTIIDDQNPFFNGNPATAYGQVPGGVMGPLRSSTYSLGSITDIVLGLDLYRATPTANQTDSWELTNSIVGVTDRNSFFIGTVALTSSGDVFFIPVGGNGALPPPAITSALVASTAVGNNFTYTITASGGPTSFGASNLPPGLSVNTITGVISGIPTQQGVFNVDISATNSAGSGSAVLVLTVSDNPNIPPIISQEIGFNSANLNSSITLTVGAVGNNLRFQWFLNGRAIRGATSPTLLVTADRRGVGRYTVEVSNTFGSVRSNGLLTIADDGLLVYRLRGSSQVADATGETSQPMQGFLVVDPTNLEGRATLITTRRVGRQTFFSTTEFAGAVYRTTGPVVRSRSVLTAAAVSGTYPDNNVQVLWLSGQDNLLSLNRDVLLIAPSAMSGLIGTLDQTDGVVIENLPISVGIDRNPTLLARTAASYNAAINLLTSGFTPEP